MVARQTWYAAASALLVWAIGGSLGYAADAPLVSVQPVVQDTAVQTATVQGVWKDAATGRIVEDYPYRAELDPGHPGRAMRPITGDNFYRDEDGVWRNARSGVSVRSYPFNAEVDPGNPDRAYRGAERFYRDASIQTQVQAQASASPNRRTTGMVFVTPHVSAGIFGLSGRSSYSSDGGQESFDNRFSLVRPQGCGGASVGTAGDVAFLADLNVCSYLQHHTLFSIPRNDAVVSLQGSSPIIFDLLFKGRVALLHPGPGSWMGPIFFSGGIGPSARKWDFTLASDQTALGADMFTKGSATWDFGAVASVGVSSFVCLTCISGGPLEVGIEARARMFRARSIDLTSPAFGFTETGATGRTIDYSVLLTAGIPFAVW